MSPNYDASFVVDPDPASGLSWKSGRVSAKRTRLKGIREDVGNEALDAEVLGLE
jgi:hypothetical protein